MLSYSKMGPSYFVFDDVENINDVVVNIFDSVVNVFDAVENKMGSTLQGKRIKK